MPGNRQYVTGWGNYDANTIQILYFEYKTYMNQVFKLKQTDNNSKAFSSIINGTEKSFDKFSNSIDSVLHSPFIKLFSLSYMYAIPPLIPAAKFLPVFPKTITLPPVMYSHP